MNKQLSVILLAGLFGLMAGCSSTAKDESTASDNGATTDTTKAVDTGGNGNATEMSSGSDALSKRVVYFEFDSSDVSSEARDIISAHAQNLAQNGSLSVVLEGHADERGTREYNIALGERRAKAVKQLFVVQGVQSSQIKVVSFGEERPAMTGHDDNAMSLNRRVEIIYSGS